MSFLPADAAQIYKSKSGAKLTIYGGFLLDNDEIRSFLAAQGVLPRNGPANDIFQWLQDRELRVFLEVCRVRPPDCELEDNPARALIGFTQETVSHADIDLTDSGVVPLKPHEATEGEKERVRRWLQVAPGDTDAYDAHVTDLAQRIFYFDLNRSDEEVTAIFEHIGRIVGQAPRELQFTVVYNWDQMQDIKGHEEWLNRRYQEMMESQQAEGVVDVSSQRAGRESFNLGLSLDVVEPSV